MENTNREITVEERKKLVWHDAATGGLYLGLTLVAILVISYLGRLEGSSLSWIPGILNFLALVVFLLLYARKVGAYYRTTGFYYPQSLAFILKMLLFAGVLAGIGQYILLNFVDPGYYNAVLENTLTESGFKQEDIDLAMQTGVIKSPMLMVLSSVIGMLLYGGVVGLVISAFVKRPAVPQDPNASQEQTSTDNNATHDNE